MAQIGKQAGTEENFSMLMKRTMSCTYGTKIIDLIFNYFLARSLERFRYFISSEHCIILRNIVWRL